MTRIKDFMLEMAWAGWNELEKVVVAISEKEGREGEEELEVE